MKRAPCNCHAYAFPHRFGSGRCDAHAGSVYCQSCGLACDTHNEDQGIGAYEFWGATGVHKHIVEVSDCCCDEVSDTPPPIAPNHTKQTTKESINV